MIKEEFSMSDWRSKYLFKENKEPVSIDEQPIEEQPVNETEKNENLIDEIGTFWVVTKPTQKQTKEDILEEYDVFSLGNEFFVGGDNSNKSPRIIMGIYLKRGDAARRAKELIQERDSHLKEVEGAMTAYRESKKEVDNKKNYAKDIINKLK